MPRQKIFTKLWRCIQPIWSSYYQRNYWE